MTGRHADVFDRGQTADAIAQLLGRNPPIVLSADDDTLVATRRSHRSPWRLRPCRQDDTNAILQEELDHGRAGEIRVFDLDFPADQCEISGTAHITFPTGAERVKPR